MVSFTFRVPNKIYIEKHIHLEYFETVKVHLLAVWERQQAD